MSWAVPKGPSQDPSQRRLAVHVEDHPLEYGEFEGTIPKGEYGGGTVMVWDRGTWEPLEDPKRGYRKGHLKFRLHGKRLKGIWSLVRIGGKNEVGDAKNWLLIKGDDEYAAQRELLEEETSVASGRTMEQIAGNHQARSWKSGRASARKESPARRTGSIRPSRTGRETASITKARIAPALCTNARKARQPKEFSPQLATLVSQVPRGQEWLHEIKLDGYRILCFLENGKARLISRNGKDWTHEFPTMVWAAEQLPIKDAILDGEAVMLRPDGATDFQALQNRIKSGMDQKKKDSIRYFVFDMPFCEGYDLTRTPLVERKQLLSELLKSAKESSKVFVYSDHVIGAGDKVMKAACDHSMEGVVSKQAAAAYDQRRTRTWLKIKCMREQEFVIGGYTEPNNSRKGFGALLLGFYEGESLIYAGRVGTGFSQATLRTLHRQLTALELKRPPFSNPPTGAEARGVHWVKPKLVAEVEFNEWTRQGILRHPSFKGIRTDKDPREVKRERPLAIPAARKSARTKVTERLTKRQRDARSRDAKPDSTVTMSAAGSQKPGHTKAAAGLRIGGVTMTNPGRVLYPEQGITKAELAKFYESICERALPHIANRPLSLVRCPSGRGEKCFYQKHAPNQLPPGMGRVPIKEKASTSEYLYIRNEKGLIAAVQMGVLEFHPWGCRIDDVEKPDRLIFDLDPGPDVEWPAVIAGVRQLREMLEAVNLKSYLKTSGGKGLHVVAPVARTISWDALKSFAHGIVSAMARERPDRYLTVMTKARRPGKIFLDYLRNGRGATCVAAYSTRAREAAPVSTPIFWEELNQRMRPDRFTVRNLPERLASQKDPWADFFTVRQSITRTAMNRVKELATHLG